MELHYTTKMTDILKFHLIRRNCYGDSDIPVQVFVIENIWCSKYNHLSCHLLAFYLFGCSCAFGAFLLDVDVVFCFPVVLLVFSD